MRVRTLVVAVCVSMIWTAPAGAQIALGGGKSAKFKKPASGRNAALVKFLNDTALLVPISPLCPAITQVTIAPSNAPASTITLPCANWTGAGTRFRYRDRQAAAGGVRSIVYKSGKLIIQLRGPDYAAVSGPLTSVEVSFRVGATAWCGRFAEFSRNHPEWVFAVGPSQACTPFTPTPTMTPTPTPAPCPPGFDCLGLAVQAGPGALAPTDDGHATWFRITNLAAYLGVVAENGTNGQLNPGPLVVELAQQVDANGRRSLRLRDTVILGAPLPAGSGQVGSACFRLQPDPAASGWIDCDGGSNADVTTSVDSQGALAADPPSFAVGAGGADGGPGAGVLRVLLQSTHTTDATTPCAAADFSGAPVIQTALTTAAASSQVLNTRQHAERPANYPASDALVGLAGQPFDCSQWQPGYRASIAMPLFALDAAAGVIPGLYDLAEVLRLDVVAASVGDPGTPIPTAAPATSTATPTPSGPTPTSAPVSCPPGTQCAAFSIVPGSGALLPSDDGAATWLRLFDFTGLGIFGNAADGHFGPSPIVLAKGASNGSGVAPLTWVGTSYLGANLVADAQSLGQTGTICVRIQQDPSNTGWIDCDGGTNANASLSVDSNLDSPPPPNPAPVLTALGAADGAAAAGSSLVRVITQFTVLAENNGNCSLADYSGAPVIASAFTTATATSTVVNDWINGAGPQSQGPNTTTLSGVPFTCVGWGGGTGATSSIAAPLFALDFTAPIINSIVDVAQVFRLNLQPQTLPDPNDTPTRSPTATPTQTPTATNTVTPSATPTSTPTSSSTPSVTPAVTSTPTNMGVATDTPTSTPTDTPFPTCAPDLTATPPPTPTGTILSAVVVTNNTSNFGPTGATFVGNCRTQGKSSGATVASSGNSFTTKFGENVADDCETTLADSTATLNTNYAVAFAVTCPAGWTYQLDVGTALVGNLHIHGDENESCSGAASTGVNSTATVSAVSGTNSTGTLASGNLNLTAPGTLVGNDNHNLAVNSTGTATIVGAGTGSPVTQTLTFTWSASCTSKGDAGSQGAECQVALGAATDLGCWNSGYPGTLSSDGHFVTVTAQCIFPTPTPQPTCGVPTPTNTPTNTSTSTPTVTFGPSLTPTRTPTVTPTPPATSTPTITGTPTPSPTATTTPVATPLGTLNFLVVTGPGGSDTSPGCPGEPSNGSLLKTDGGPTGGIPGTICNGTKGHFTTFPANTPLQLVGGVPDGSGVASLSIAAAVVIGSDLPTTTPNCGSSCEACWRIEQDTTNGYVDCDGGSNADVNLTINSNGSSAPPAPSSGPYTLGTADSGSGAAVIRAIIKRKRVNGTSTCPSPGDSAWNTPDSTVNALIVTGTAVSRIDSPHVCSGNNFGTACPSKDPFQVSLVGSNLSCAGWSSQTGKKLVTPFQNLEESIGGSFSNGDIAQVLRLQN